MFLRHGFFQVAVGVLILRFHLSSSHPHTDLLMCLSSIFVGASGLSCLFYLLSEVPWRSISFISVSVYLNISLISYHCLSSRSSGHVRDRISRIHFINLIIRSIINSFQVHSSASQHFIQ